MIDKLAGDCARALLEKQDAEMAKALESACPGLTMHDALRRCRLIKFHASEVETLYFDTKPILELHPIESTTELRCDTYVTTFTRKYRQLHTV